MRTASSIGASFRACQGSPGCSFFSSDESKVVVFRRRNECIAVRIEVPVTTASEYLEDSKELIARIRTIPLLRPFSERDIRGLIKLSRLVKYDPSDRIIEEGQLDNRIYFLIRGVVGVEKGGKIISRLRRVGDLFGEMGIIDGSPRSASIVAQTEAVCLVVDVSYMDRLEGDEKTAFAAVLYRVFAEILSNRLRLMDERVIRLSEENKRLQKELSKRGLPLPD